MHLLLINFDDTLIEIFGNFLNDKGYQTSTARTSNIVEICAEYNPNALLLFHKWPIGKEYVELCREIRTNPKTENIFFFIFSATEIRYDYSPDLFPPPEWEPDGYFDIPFELDEAEQQIRNIIKKSN